jgi:hypothetical protein
VETAMADFDRPDQLTDKRAPTQRDARMKKFVQIVVVASLVSLSAPAMATEKSDQLYSWAASIATSLLSVFRKPAASVPTADSNTRLLTAKAFHRPPPPPYPPEDCGRNCGNGNGGL